MNMVIAGGSGLIGRELTSALTQNGDEVTILSRFPEKVIDMPRGAKAVQWNGKNLDNWVKVINNAQVVINLTGENLSGNGILPSRWTQARKKRIIQSRIDSGRILAKAIEIANKKPSVFIQASGINYYKMYADKSITEEDEAGNDFLGNLSIEWEASSAAVESMGVRRVVIRNGVVLSNRGGALPSLTLPFKLFVGGKLGSGDQIYSWIHIKDIVSAIIFLIQNDRANGPYNLTSPNPVSNSEFGRTIAKVLKRPYYFTIPSIVMRLAFGEVASVVLTGQKVIPQKLIESGYEFKFSNLEDTLYDILK
jgi:uncharacterized protein (TIGR01777 family)